MDKQALREYYKSFPGSWSLVPEERGYFKELKTKTMPSQKFNGAKGKYPQWARAFQAAIHAKKMLIADKVLALVTALDETDPQMKVLISGISYTPEGYKAAITNLQRPR
jgi:hypothetical protein